MAIPKRRVFKSSLRAHCATGMAGALATVLIATLPASAQSTAPAGNPAHSIANRFAEDVERADAARKEAARKAAEQRKLEAAKAKAQRAHEAEMIARARAEAEDRRKLEEQAARLDALRAERDAREAEAERQRVQKTREIEAARQAEQQRVAEENRKAEEARRAEVQRLAEAARKAEEDRKADEMKRAAEARKAEETRKAGEALRVAAEKAAAEEAARAQAAKRAEQTRRVADVETDAEIARVADELRRIRDAHMARIMGQNAGQNAGSNTGSGTAPAAPPAIAPAKPPVTVAKQESVLEPASGRGRIPAGTPSQAEYREYRDVPLQPPRGRAQPDDPEPPAAYSDPKLAPERDDARDYGRYEGRVTVLLQMEPRFHRGRGFESMDPVLCTPDGCYVSNGPVSAASFLYGRGAMRFGNAIGRRAGACNGDTTCVFRNVNLGALPAVVQPVDIRILHHDRRNPEEVEALSKCRIGIGDRLSCTDGIEGDGYTLWVIPEQFAERLPPHVLANAMSSGISDADRADAAPRLLAPRGRW